VRRLLLKRKTRNGTVLNKIQRFAILAICAIYAIYAMNAMKNFIPPQIQQCFATPFLNLFRSWS